MGVRSTSQRLLGSSRNTLLFGSHASREDQTTTSKEIIVWLAWLIINQESTKLVNSLAKTPRKVPSCVQQLVAEF